MGKDLTRGGKLSQNSPILVLICWRVFFLYTLLKVISRCDLSLLSMSVMGFLKKSLDRGIGGVSYI